MNFATTVLIEATLNHAAFYLQRLRNHAADYKSDAARANAELELSLPQITQAFAHLQTYSDTVPEAQSLLIDFVRAGIEQLSVRLAPDEWHLWLDAGQRIASAIGDHHAFCNFQIEQSNIYFRRGEHDLALGIITDVLAMAQQLNSDYLLGRCHFGLALIFQMQSKVKQAAQHVDMAYQHFQAIDDHYQIGRVVSFIAQQAIDAFEYAKAERLLRQNIERWQELGNLRRTAVDQYQLGVLFFNSRQYVRALDLLQVAYATGEQLDDKRYLGLVTQLMGHAYIEQNDFEAALAMLEEAMNHFNDAQDKRGNAATLNMLGKLLLKSGDVEGAKAYHQAALETATAVNYVFHTIDALRFLGIVYTRQRQFDTAARYLYDALVQARQSHVKLHAFVVLQDVLRLFIANDDWETAAQLDGFLAVAVANEDLQNALLTERATLAQALPDDAYQQLRMAGQALDLDDILALLT